MGLSAGQMQRLALARAFLKEAPFLILDEPTSSLDPESEVLIRQAVERLTRERTVLVIAHRSATLTGAQQIVLLEQGRLVRVESTPDPMHLAEFLPSLLADTREQEVIL